MMFEVGTVVCHPLTNQWAEPPERRFDECFKTYTLKSRFAQERPWGWIAFGINLRPSAIPYKDAVITHEVLSCENYSNQ